MARRLYDPSSNEPYRLSRSKIDLFTQCPRCFYLDQRLGIKRPSGPGFSLNSAVDTLLKKEFDLHRAAQTAHPLMKAYGLDAVPFAHTKIDEWRHNFTGVQYLEPGTNLLIFGAVDDIWIDKEGKLIVVDYKSTSTAEEITLEGQYKEGYKRQMEIYQWLLAKNGFEISPTGYFVYCNGLKDRAAFDGKLEFDIKLIPYTGNHSWMEPTVFEIKKMLDNDAIPPAIESCEHCRYVAAAANTLSLAPTPTVSITPID